jgi:putative pyrimidine permease RutG
MQQIYLDQLRRRFSWREKKTGTIGPDERLPWPNTIAMGMQHVLAMFGSTVVAPLIMGFDPNLAILFSGIGTLLFFAITAGKVPSYLGSSFAFIAPVAAAVAGSGGMKGALGGIIAAGVIYLLIGLIVQYTGSGWIDALMPPLVTGAVVAIIGLNLAGAARNLAAASMPLALFTILAVMVVAIVGRGMLGRLPILLGTLIGYLIAILLGGTNTAGRSIGPMHISGVDFQPVRDAAWLGWPNFTGPSFNWHAITLIAPVAIILVAENTGHIKAVSEMTGRNLMPFLGRGFIGDGLATTIAGFGGGTGVTTYAENIGVMAVTKVFSTAIFVVAAVTAIVLGFCPKFGALIGSIPSAVLGGVATVLFGLIAVTGVRIWVENRVDFSKSSNLFIAAVALIVGAADYTINIGDFALAGIGLGTFGAIILYQIFKALGIEDAPLAIDGPAGAVPHSGSELRGGGRSPSRASQAQTAEGPNSRALRRVFSDSGSETAVAVDDRYSDDVQDHHDRDSHPSVRSRMQPQPQPQPPSRQQQQSRQQAGPGQQARQQAGQRRPQPDPRRQPSEDELRQQPVQPVQPDEQRDPRWQTQPGQQNAQRRPTMPGGAPPARSGGQGAGRQEQRPDSSQQPTLRPQRAAPAPSRQRTSPTPTTAPRADSASQRTAPNRNRTGLPDLPEPDEKD